MDGLAAAVVGAVVGGVVGGVTSYFEVRRNYRVGIDKELRDARLAAYPRVWAALKRLSQHRDLAPSPRELHQLVSDLTDWYYDVGGLYLTSESQPAFKDLVEDIKKVAGEGSDTDPVESTTHDRLYISGSRFRAFLTLDLSSRDEALFQTRRHKKLRKKVLDSFGPGTDTSRRPPPQPPA